MLPSALLDLTALRVLCVDDDPVMRTLIGSVLKHRGCRDVVQAHNAAEALKHCEARDFDLIIADYRMTPMDGIAFLRTLSERGRAAGWPVIMLSAESDPVPVAEALALGVSAWLCKPISALKLIERIGAALHKDVAPARGNAGPGSAAYHGTGLIVGIAGLEERLAVFQLQPREATTHVRQLQRQLESLAEQASAAGFELAAVLAGRAVLLLRAAEANPQVAAPRLVLLGRAVSMLATAMRRVVQNQMFGDGGEAGTRLLARLDELTGPLRQALGPVGLQAAPATRTDRPAAVT
jgi:two-component system chemotaxis response regulator CheY